MFRAGDRFLLTCQAVNMGQMVTVNQYVILDVYGAYYFWPSWTPSLDNLMRDLPADYMGEVDILLDFIWPEGAGAADGILFYSAFTDPGNTQLIGGLSLIEWGFE